MFMLDVGAVNSFVLFHQNKSNNLDCMNHVLDKNRKRTEFLNRLCFDLILPCIHERFLRITEMKFSGVHIHILESCRRLGIERPESFEPNQGQFRSSCKIRGCKNKTSQNCFECNSFYCGRHSQKLSLCLSCFNKD
jgi:hypothetical protein